MKLRISDLTDAGIEVSGELRPDGLNARLNNAPDPHAKDSDIQFQVPVQVAMHARRTAGGAELSGKLSGSYTQGCGRCLDAVPRDFTIDCTFLIKASPRGEPDLVDDVGVIYFRGEHCDLESPLQETVLLSMSLYWSPEIDREGRCASCKNPCSLHQRTGPAANSAANHGSTTRLADLLKKL